MKHSKLIHEIQAFLDLHHCKAVDLARAANVSESTISRLRRAAQPDCYNVTAEKIRRAMRLATVIEEDNEPNQMPTHSADTANGRAE